jgi:pilus assembly protein Flp/PilA
LPVLRRDEQADAREEDEFQKERGSISMLAFIREDEGQGLVEYALIIAVIAIAVIVAMIFLRGQLQNIFSNIGNNLT